MSSDRGYFELALDEQDAGCAGPAEHRKGRGAGRRVISYMFAWIVGPGCLVMAIFLVFTISSKLRHLDLACSKSRAFTVSPWQRPPSSVDSVWQSTDDFTQQPRMMIFQHFNLHNDRIRELQHLSTEQHRRYAEFWGYQYTASSEQFVSEKNTTVRQRQMNKVYALLKVVIEEIAKGEDGAQWIHITDADVLIVDPTVPLHSLLPDDNVRKEIGRAFIIGSEDANGYNSGNMIYRCGIELAAYLSHTLAISDDVTKNYDKVMSESPDGKEPHGIETPPSDQRALCLVLEDRPTYASRFFHYPQRWLNSYDLPQKNDLGVQLHTHLVAGRKYRANYDEYVAEETVGWRRLNSMTGQDAIQRASDVHSRAADWWKDARVGLPKCIWI